MSWPEGVAAREEHWTGRRASHPQTCAFIVFSPDELDTSEYVRVAYPLWTDILTRLGFTHTHTQPTNGTSSDQPSTTT